MKNAHFKVRYINDSALKSQCVVAISANDAITKFKEKNKEIPVGNVLNAQEIDGQEEVLSLINVLKALSILILIAGLMLGVALMPTDQQLAMLELLGQELPTGAYLLGYTSMVSAAITSVLLWALADMVSNLRQINSKAG